MYSLMFELHAELLKALAHPRRLEIIQLLRENELPVTDIHTMLDLPQANISQHLMVLREAGVLECRRDGKQMYYRIADQKIIAACDLLREVLADKLQNPSLSNELNLPMSELLPIVHDPVCRMRVSPKTAGFSTNYLDTTYYFCASGCHKKFTTTPEVYAHH
jgi:ArsR family transcriptional regulator, virulence genes transcriptional regulator